MTEIHAFMVGLFVMLAVVAPTAAAHRDQREQMLRTAVAILCNWIAGVAYVSITDNHSAWHFNIFIDAAAAFAVMFHPAGKVQGFIGLFYLIQIAGHVAFGIRRLTGMSADPIYYYDAITYVAWLQLAAMGAWCGGVWIGNLLHHLRHRGDAPDRRASHSHSRKAK